MVSNIVLQWEMFGKMELVLCGRRPGIEAPEGIPLASAHAQPIMNKRHAQRRRKPNELQLDEGHAGSYDFRPCSANDHRQFFCTRAP